MFKPMILVLSLFVTLSSHAEMSDAEKAFVVNAISAGDYSVLDALTINHKGTGKRHHSGGIYCFTESMSCAGESYRADSPQQCPSGTRSWNYWDDATDCHIYP